MHVAMNRLSDDGRRINTFQFADRTTSASRAIVKPSPDLAYASCVYDLSDGPIVVEVPPTEGGGYVSVSVFAANTDNFAVVDSLANPRGIRFVLQEPGQPNGSIQIEATLGNLADGDTKERPEGARLMSG